MLFKILGILILLMFYYFYIAKMVAQSKQSIKTNQVGKGDKPKKVIMIERMMSLASSLTIVAEVLSIFIVKNYFNDIIRIIGVIFGILSVILFAAATFTMKNSWRAGIPEKKTEIITDGIYKISRNPAFLGFDFLYISIVLMFFNIPLLLCSLWAAVMLHLQILQEEEWLADTFGDEYKEYRKKVNRYFGRKNK